MWERAIVLLLAAVTVPDSTSCASQNMRVGVAINLFSRYGYLSISMKVVPRNDSDHWLFREPSVDVFRNLSYLQTPVRGLPGTGTPVFQGDFHMEFCDNMKQLLQAYFRDFKMERLERPWRAFSASWGKSTLAKHLGINSSYVTGQHSYVLVRVARHRDSGRLGDPPPGGTLPVEEIVAEEVDRIVPGDVPSVGRFVKNFGSHYVASYVTGNALYQVFVYTPQIYSKIKERLRAKGVSDLSNVELSSFFSPWYAEHIGTIQTASGNSTVDAWVADHLRVHFYFFTYASLLKLHGDAGLLRQLNHLLGNEAVLQLDLRTLAPAFSDPVKRAWFEVVLDNSLQLWEVNM